MQTSTTNRLWTRDFGLLCGSSLLVWGSFYVLMPALPLYAVRLGGSPSQVGLVNAIMTLGTILVRPLSGFVADRWGRRWVHLGLLLLLVAVTFSFHLVHTLAALLLVRFLMGMPFGGATTVGQTVAADLVPAGRRGEGIGYYTLAQTVAMAGGPALAYPVLALGGFPRLFTAAALLTLGAPVLAWCIRHPVVRCPEARLTLSSILERRAAWVSLTALMVALCYSTVMSFLSVYAEELHMPQSGAFFGLLAVGMMVVRPTAGRAFDRRGPGLVVALGMALLAAAYLGLAVWHSSAGFLLTAFVYGVGYGMVIPSLQAMAVNVVEPERRGAANATLFTLFDAGMGIGAYGMGLVAQVAGGYAAMYGAAAALTVLPLALFFGLALPRYRPFQP